MTEESLAFRVRETNGAGVEVRVNFGVFAGRNATQAEIDDLGRALRTVADSFSIVAEDRHEFGGAVETAVRQIVIEVEGDGDREALGRLVLGLAKQWAAECIRSRSDLGELGSEL